MPIDYDRLMRLPPIEQTSSYTQRDAMLYALGLGVGADDSTSAETLRYCYEANLEVLPTMAVVIGSPGFWLKDPCYGIDWRRLLHGEQSLTLHRPLPTHATITSRLQIEDIYDKGRDTGALLFAAREIRESNSGEKLATLRYCYVLRGDGGFGGKARGAQQRQAIPERTADESLEISTRRDQALLYRLSGDYNPLHVDPIIARAGGFSRPVLHGLCTYGIVARALIRLLCNHDPKPFRHLAVRFSNPVYPGDTIKTEMWRGPDGTAFVRATVPERGVRIIDNGLFEYGPSTL